MSESLEMLSEFYFRRHPEYDQKLDHWRFCRATYKGGREWFAGNIFKYYKEGSREYKKRIERAYRFNHTKEVVELVQKYLFKAPVQRSPDAHEAIKKFWAKATLAGGDIDTLVRAGSTSNSLTGICAVVVDNNAPLDEKDVISVKDAEDVSIYAYIVDAEDILDWAYDEDGDGQLLWVKIREFVRDDSDYLNSTGDLVERVRVWTREEWILYEPRSSKAMPGVGRAANQKRSGISVVETKRGRHNLGFVPVELFRHTPSEEPYSCSSLIDEIAYLDRTVANYLSNLDAIIQDQTFSQLAIPAQSVSSADDDNKKVLEMSTKRVFTYDGGAGSHSKPEFISPDPKQAHVILDAINKIISEIYHTIGLAGERTKEDNAVGIDNSSGVAKAYDFERVNALLRSKALMCEKLENWLVKCVLAYVGEEIADDEKLVTYPSTFDVMRLADELTTAEALQKISAPDEVRKLQMKNLSKKLFPQIDKKTEQKIIKSIDDWKPTETTKTAAPFRSDPAITDKQPSGNGKSVAQPKRQGQVTKDTPSK